MELPVNLVWLTLKTISLSWKCPSHNLTAVRPSINQVIRQLVTVTNNFQVDDWHNKNQICWSHRGCYAEFAWDAIVAHTHTHTRTHTYIRYLFLFHSDPCSPSLPCLLPQSAVLPAPHCRMLFNQKGVGQREFVYLTLDLLLWRFIPQTPVLGLRPEYTGSSPSYLSNWSVPRPCCPLPNGAHLCIEETNSIKPLTKHLQITLLLWESECCCSTRREATP